MPAQAIARSTNSGGADCSASGGLLQRRLGLPDASVLVLQGIIFVFVLASDALYGRIGFLKGKS